MAITQQSTKCRKMTRVSAADKKRRQRWRTRYCKNGCRRQESDNDKIDSGSGKDSLVATMINWWRWQPAARFKSWRRNTSNRRWHCRRRRRRPGQRRRQQLRSRTENGTTAKACAAAGRQRQQRWRRRRWRQARADADGQETRAGAAANNDGIT